MGDSEEPQMSFESAYKQRLFMEWVNITEVSILCRISIIENMNSQSSEEDFDPDSMREFIARITRMWLELQPEVQEREDFKTTTLKSGESLFDKFMSFEEKCMAPEKLIEEENWGQILELEQTIRITLGQLGVISL